MDDQDLTERFVSGKAVFEGRMLHVRCDTVTLPDGKQATREYIRHPGAVAVLAFAQDGRLVLERQYRYALARAFIEAPAGKIEPGEDLLATAQRELLEETGYAASHWRRVATLHNAIGYSDEAIELFVAHGLEKRQQNLDHEEFLDVLLVPFDEALGMVRDGRITDTKTMVALLWMAAFEPPGAA